MVMDLVMSLKADEHSFDNVCLVLLAHALIALKSPDVTEALLDVVWNKLETQINWGCPMPDLIKAMSRLPEVTPLSTLYPVDEGDRSLYDCPLDALATVYDTYPSLAVYLRPLLSRETTMAAGLLGETPVASRVMCLIGEKYPDMASLVTMNLKMWLAVTLEASAIELDEGGLNLSVSGVSPLYPKGSGKTSGLVGLAMVADGFHGSALAHLLEGAVGCARQTHPWYMEVAEAIVRVRLDTYPLYHRVCMRMPSAAAMEMLTSLPHGCLGATDGNEAMPLVEALAKLSLTAPAHLPVWIEMCPQLSTMTNTPVLDLRDMAESEGCQSLISFLHATPSSHVLLPETLTGTIVSVIRDAALAVPVTPLSGIPIDLQIQKTGILPCQYPLVAEDLERQCCLTLTPIPDSEREAKFVSYNILDHSCVTHRYGQGESVVCLKYHSSQGDWSTRTLNLSSLTSGESLPDWSPTSGPSLKPDRENSHSVTILPIGGGRLILVREDVVMALEPHVSIDESTGEISVSGDWLELPPCPESLRPILSGDAFVSQGKLHILPSGRTQDNIPGHLSLSASGCWDTLTNWRRDIAPGGDNDLVSPGFLRLGHMLVTTSHFPVRAFDLVTGTMVNVLTDPEDEDSKDLGFEMPKIVCVLSETDSEVCVLANFEETVMKLITIQYKRAL
ncbi:hypothetical protein KIPB_001432 [Kipferlia bialata]|uniref:Uncharacterized protein n=1 Tax=Kipferlia bialata TaxID=797122 RepID=A0A9K3GFY3_9EUKA|nr:hypothetical protein KIPB_001432 [Kipferlia bialata]|eukprot:g1432.t1